MHTVGFVKTSGISLAISTLWFSPIQTNSEESEMSVAWKILIRGSRGMIAMVIATSLTPPQLLAAPKHAVSTKTMQNLQSALNGERNAHSRYLAFAEKADQEGYGGVASLFRAAAAAEEVHGDNHEQTIRDLGGLQT